MGKRRKVPEDLMGTILGEGSGAASGEHAYPEPRGNHRETASSFPASEGTFSWEDQPERVGVTFNLSKQLTAELDRLRQDLRLEGDVRPSKSEIVEVALRIAVEDVRDRGGESELIGRLGERPVDQTAGAAGGTTNEVISRTTTRRSVDASGFIVETTYDDKGEIVDEDVVGNLSDLLVEDEFLDNQGRVVSRVRDESGTVIEQILDDKGDVVGARILGEG